MFQRRARVVIAVLIVISLTFAILDLRGGKGPFATFRSVVGTALGGIERAGATVFSPVLAIGDWWGTWGDQREKISELQAQNQALSDLVRRSAEDRARANALDGLLRVAGAGRYRITPAEVIAVGPEQEFSWTVTIDIGTQDGIERDMSVINADGLVGRVSAVHRTTSTVMLIVDPSMSVGARIAGSQEVGILSGTGDQNSLEFQMLDPLADVEIGAALVTFGSKNGKPYAPGIPIGEVTEVRGTAGQLTRVATIKPFARMSALSVVGVVVRPPRTDPRDSVLPDRPKSPTPTPTPTPSSSRGAGWSDVTPAPSPKAS
ncbi:MAG: rod shape-determining protein MreC [Candidatus Nanopelagicales bacterium]|nr:rod shape-determining protein MreC [Candidatus Nanopelagicales bacterium]